jgi:hypothetical protein
MPSPRAAPAALLAAALLAPACASAAAAADAGGKAPAQAGGSSATSGRRASTDVPLPPPPVLRPAPRGGTGAGAPPASGPSAPAPAPDLPPDFRPRAADSKPARRALRLAVPDFRVQGDLPARQLALVEQALLAELRKLDGVSAIGMGEIREMLSFEYHRRMLGCQADEACLAEISGALGTDEMLNASIVVEGQSATFALKRINMRAAKVTGADQRRLVRANGEELLGAVGPAVQTLFPDRELKPGRTRGVDKEVALRLNPPPLPRWTFYATAGAAAAAVAAGATFGYLANDSRHQYASLANRSLTEPVSGSQLRSLQSTTSQRARTANLFLVAGGALAVAAGVEAFFTDWHGYRAAVEVGPQSAGVGVGGTF